MSKYWQDDISSLKRGRFKMIFSVGFLSLRVFLEIGKSQSKNYFGERSLNIRINHKWLSDKLFSNLISQFCCRDLIPHSVLCVKQCPSHSTHICLGTCGLVFVSVNVQQLEEKEVEEKRRENARRRRRITITTTARTRTRRTKRRRRKIEDIEEIDCEGVEETIREKARWIVNKRKKKEKKEWGWILCGGIW